jgi:hypothetical protein
MRDMRRLDRGLSAIYSGPSHHCLGRPFAASYSAHDWGIGTLAFVTVVILAYLCAVIIWLGKGYGRRRGSRSIPQET